MAASKMTSYNGGLSAAGILMEFAGNHRAAHMSSLISAFSWNNTFGGHGGNFWNNFWSPLGANHPIMQVASDAALSQSLWSELPPVTAPMMIRQLAPESQVLAYGRSARQQNRMAPLVAIRSNGAHKSAAIFATQLWRWDFMMRGINRTEDVYTQLLHNMIRWL